MLAYPCSHSYQRLYHPVSNTIRPSGLRQFTRASAKSSLHNRPKSNPFRRKFPSGIRVTSSRYQHKLPAPQDRNVDTDGDEESVISAKEGSNGRTQNEANVQSDRLPRACFPSNPREPSAWLSVIEPILPKNLRESNQDFIKEATFTEYLPQILVRAERSYDINILHELGHERGRWRAVVWLVKQAIDKTSAAKPNSAVAIAHSGFNWLYIEDHDTKPRHTPSNLDDDPRIVQWAEDESLDKITDNPIWLSLPQGVQFGPARSLEEETRHLKPPESIDHALRNTLVGQIWRTLAFTIIKDTKEQIEGKESIMPYVLEIIAHFHHVGIVPDSVYDYSPRLDKGRLRQPPMLHVLRSRILTALSDAAWHAHESEVKEEKIAAGARNTFLGHEVPGSRYRLRGVTLGPEVWLELILWSCLYGSWVEDGIAILREVFRRDTPKKYRWSLVSWHDLAEKVQFADGESVDWSTAGGLLSVPLSDVSKEDHKHGRSRIERTISSEAVAAYVDALICSVHVGVGARGTPVYRIVNDLMAMKKALERINMSLGVTSWDAVIVRLVESQSIDIYEDPEFFGWLLSHLNTKFAEELGTANSQARVRRNKDTSYIFDGTAAVLGLYHRTLRAFVSRGDIDKAIKTFEELQDYTDHNKEKAIREFLTSLRHTTARDLEEGDFTPNLPSIEFPAFFPQLPSTLLGPLLDLVTSSEGFEFGTHLIYSHDLDGPQIGRNRYQDPLLAGPLIRFATATNDSDLLTNVVNELRYGSKLRDFDATGVSQETDQNLPDEVINGFVDNQIQNRKWPAVEQLLLRIRDSPTLIWTAAQVYTLIKEILFHRIDISTVLAEEIDDSTANLQGLIKADSDLEDDTQVSMAQALRIFLDLLSGIYGRGPRAKRADDGSSLDSFLAVVADIGGGWTTIVNKVKKFHRSQPARLNRDALHPLLEAIVTNKGCYAGLMIVRKWFRGFDQRENDISIGNKGKKMGWRRLSYQQEDSQPILGEEAEQTNEELDELLFPTEPVDLSSNGMLHPEDGSQALPEMPDTVPGEDDTAQPSTDEPMEETDDHSSGIDDLDFSRRGGIWTMSRKRGIRTIASHHDTIRVVLDKKENRVVSFVGKVKPNLTTIEILLRSAQIEWRNIRYVDRGARREGIAEVDPDREVRKNEVAVVLRWALKSMRELGISEDDARRKMSFRFRN
ncbi:MAG: hypothetical protein M1820_009137 [Bogoriella megaspora]|nr:MAG: hypothetical protein M1820_009137 [Bogoriella megaspora]